MNGLPRAAMTRRLFIALSMAGNILQAALTLCRPKVLKGSSPLVLLATNQIAFQDKGQHEQSMAVVPISAAHVTSSAWP